MPEVIPAWAEPTAAPVTEAQVPDWADESSSAVSQVPDWAGDEEDSSPEIPTPETNKAIKLAATETFTGTPAELSDLKSQSDTSEFGKGLGKAVSEAIPQSWGAIGHMAVGLTPATGGVEEIVQAGQNIGKVAGGAPIEQTFQEKPFTEYTTEDWGHFVGQMGIQAAQAIPLFRGLHAGIKAEIMAKAAERATPPELPAWATTQYPYPEAGRDIMRQGQMARAMPPDLIEAMAVARAEAPEAEVVGREATGPVAETAAEKAMRRTGEPVRTAAEIAMEEAPIAPPGIQMPEIPGESMARFKPEGGEEGAITEGQIRQGSEQEHIGVPPREDISAYPEEVRGSEGEQASDSGSVGTAPQEPVEGQQPPGIRNVSIEEGIKSGELPEEAMVTGEGWNATAARDFGRKRLAEDPQAAFKIARRLKRTGGMEPGDTSVLHAYHDQLSTIARDARMAADAAPLDKALEARAMDAEKAQVDFLTDVAPLAKGAVQREMVGFQGAYPPDLETAAGIRKEIVTNQGKELSSHQRRVSYKLAGKTQKVVKDIVDHSNRLQQAIDRDLPRRPAPTKEQMKASASEFIKRAAPCVVK